MNYQTVVGLEVHVELATKTKIFCGCTTEFGGEPNTHVCPVCSGMPGVLPVLNKKVVEYAVRAGLALNCDIIPFIPICQRLIRSASSICLSAATARWRLKWTA